MIELTERKARKEKFRVEALERIFEKPYHGDYDDCSYEDGHSNVHLCTACEENQSTGEWINETMDNLVLPFVYNKNEKLIPVNDSIKIKKNDHVTFLINLRRKSHRHNS